MKKFVLMLMFCVGCLVASNSYAVDATVSGEYKMYQHDGARQFEGVANLGQQLGKFRPFAEIKYNADNTTKVMDHTSAEYKLGIGTTLLPLLNIEAGGMFYQNLHPNTLNDRGLFVKVTYSFDSKSKKK